MRFLVVILACSLLGACTSAPIKVGPGPDVAAVRIQNETTKKHVASFSESNTKTRAHVQKVKDEHTSESDKLQSVKRDLEELLRQ